MVPVSGSSPFLSVEDYQDGGIRVGCRATGWYPKPEMLWRDFQGQQLPSFTESDSQDQNGFFEVEKSIVIQRNAKRNVSCSVRSPRLPQEKDSTIYISGDLPPAREPCPGNKGFLPLILRTQPLSAASEAAPGRGGSAASPDGDLRLPALRASRACDGGGTGFWTLGDRVRDIQHYFFSRKLLSA